MCLKAVSLLCLLLCATQSFAQKTTVQNIEPRVEALLARMTLEEKIGQLHQVPGDISTGTNVAKDDLLNLVRSGGVGSVLSHTNFQNKMTIQRVATRETRLGIPIIFGFDVIHGYKTIFPIPLAQAASWDLALIEQIERIAAEEASADGQHWAFAPMLDISHEPRWGRVMEGAGEDPFLASRIAEARVRGLQGNDLSAPNTVAACAKHFAGYGFVEAGREYNSVDMSEQRLRELVLPPFEAAAKAGCATFMNAFNTLNGTPATMHKSLVNNILRGEWGWNGLVVSDWASVGETIMHGAAEDTTDAAAKCLAAGCDMDMAGGSYRRGIKKALEQGRITQAQIDEAVRRVLRLKFMLGLFDDPFKYLDRERRNNTLEKPEYRAKAREAAAKSMVLLKNDGGLLPIQPGGPFKKIAIVGPYADSRGNKDYMSFWTLGLGPGIHDYDSSKVVTPVQALKPALEAQGIEVVVVQSRLDGPEDGRYTAAMEACRDVDLIIACVGERGFDSGECRSVTDINLPKNQERMLRMVSRNGERAMVVVLFNSRPLTFPWADQNATAILNAWQPGYETGNALADILLGRANPSGRLPITFPRTLGQVPLYYNAPNTGRPQQQQGEMWKSGYLDAPNSPAYPFGFGLSYTHCSYSTPKLSTARLKRGETLNISVELTNTGKMAMEETAQCYIRDLSADIARPVKELKAFEKVKLQPGEKKTVVFRLSEKDLAYWNDALKFKADPGKFKLYVGRNARDAQELEFELLP